MADYNKTIWENEKTPLNAENLNKIEKGIEDSVNQGRENASLLEQIKTSLNKATQDITAVNNTLHGEGKVQIVKEAIPITSESPIIINTINWTEDKALEFMRMLWEDYALQIPQSTSTKEALITTHDGSLDISDISNIHYFSYIDAHFDSSTQVLDYISFRVNRVSGGSDTEALLTIWYYPNLNYGYEISISDNSLPTEFEVKGIIPEYNILTKYPEFFWINKEVVDKGFEGKIDTLDTIVTGAGKTETVKVGLPNFSEEPFTFHTINWTKARALNFIREYYKIIKVKFEEISANGGDLNQLIGLMTSFISGSPKESESGIQLNVDTKITATIINAIDEGIRFELFNKETRTLYIEYDVKTDSVTEFSFNNITSYDVPNSLTTVKDIWRDLKDTDPDTGEETWEVIEFIINVTDILSTFSNYFWVYKEVPIKGLVDKVNELYNTSTPVPNTGHIDKVYFNTSLTSKEVDSLLDSLPISKYMSSMEGMSLYGIAAASSLSKVLVIMDMSSLTGGEVKGYMIVDFIAMEVNNDTKGIIYISESLSALMEDDAPFFGWNPYYIASGSFTINEEVTNTAEGFPIGNANDLLTDLVAITPTFGGRVDATFVKNQIESNLPYIVYDALANDIANYTKKRALTEEEISLFNLFSTSNKQYILTSFYLEGQKIQTLTFYKLSTGLQEYKEDPDDFIFGLILVTQPTINPNGLSSTQIKIHIDLQHNNLYVEKTGSIQDTHPYGNSVTFPVTTAQPFNLSDIHRYEGFHRNLTSIQIKSSDNSLERIYTLYSKELDSTITYKYFGVEDNELVIQDITIAQDFSATLQAEQRYPLGGGGSGNSYTKEETDAMLGDIESLINELNGTGTLPKLDILIANCEVGELDGGTSYYFSSDINIRDIYKYSNIDLAATVDDGTNVSQVTLPMKSFTKVISNGLTQYQLQYDLTVLSESYTECILGTVLNSAGEVWFNAVSMGVPKESMPTTKFQLKAYNVGKASSNRDNSSEAISNIIRLDSVGVDLFTAYNGQSVDRNLTAEEVEVFKQFVNNENVTSLYAKVEGLADVVLTKSAYITQDSVDIISFSAVIMDCYLDAIICIYSEGSSVLGSIEISKRTLKIPKAHECPYFGDEIAQLINGGTVSDRKLTAAELEYFTELQDSEEDLRIKPSNFNMYMYFQKANYTKNFRLMYNTRYDSQVISIVIMFTTGMDSEDNTVGIMMSDLVTNDDFDNLEERVTTLESGGGGSSSGVRITKTTITLDISNPTKNPYEYEYVVDTENLFNALNELSSPVINVKMELVNNMLIDETTSYEAVISLPVTINYFEDMVNTLIASYSEVIDAQVGEVQTTSIQISENYVYIRSSLKDTMTFFDGAHRLIISIYSE